MMPPLATSQEIRDRGSTFVGYVYRVQTVDEARAALARHAGGDEDVSMERRAGMRHVDEGTRGRLAGNKDKNVDESRDGDGSDKNKVKVKGGLGERPYVISAWRCMAVKPGRTGVGGPDDFAIVDGCEDGGERWAGGRVLDVMQHEGVIDAVVVVCRWFGGTLLGPVRFAHIETCASEVCRRFRKIEEMDECVQTLSTLDGVLTALRAELATARSKSGVQDPSSTAENSRAKKAPDYRIMQDALDLTKAKRLIHARECAIKATKTLIEKCRASYLVQ